ncbi:MAG TPA: 3'(2'),5'-bisphosphate nucleotidase CysQ [Tenuifilaceae bacterium]|jgi:3'(2'), 5'-bisphosphate nucleotidase|nr:3'(2'),5'-bisphosphate nucleotidase CysQ [Bacteroidales bacterium]HOA09458.1 3'(2'),5'-bisphosphate nucleotidase CysQ [Tenuifilaceae bacterium]HOC35962.1 3'(2'),5'-bisphosphate nucleotidase CysQ [Tenuifilaceae bacterium]HOG72101.1 3'(2'),5'-bisphosphate nucleotidase CysQ [Tenuifilaceae bacterium]HOW20426.1 3'(2'),5'-bisphosphate nucleotidase CysQ [Tenuifilaceae bacterium]
MIEQPEIINLLVTAINTSVRAGSKIMEVYNSDDFQVNLKSDRTPLTLADRVAHEEIKNTLYKTLIPVLSEEGRSIHYVERKGWEYFWIVDPLDGTKEFIKRNGEFTVNIALMYEGFPILGVIYVPVTECLYYSIHPEGSFKVTGIKPTMEVNLTYSDVCSGAKRLPLSQNHSGIVVVESRSHNSPETLEFISNLDKKYGGITRISCGSSLKMCMVAEGIADIYPRLSLSSEWDTAAGQAIVEGAGFQVISFDSGDRMSYNKEELINPWFIVRNPARFEV